MICISLHQPWASLCVLPSLADASIPVKPYETRSFPCPQKYIGKRILVHATKKWTTGVRWLIYGPPAATGDSPFMAAIKRMPFYSRGEKTFGLPLGCIVGAVDVVECYKVVLYGMQPVGTVMSRTDVDFLPMPTGDALAFGDFSVGRFAWALRNPVMFKTPIPYKGRQGFFGVPDDVVAGQMTSNRSKA